jgi:pyrroline-5-carboxylate reductase
MASAMVEGILNKQLARPADLTCYSPSGQSAGKLATRTGIAQATSLTELSAACDILVVAFKPQHLQSKDPELARCFNGKLVISVLSGKTLKSLHRAFPQARNLVRCMPNTPSRIGAGITGWCAFAKLCDEDRTSVERLLSALGSAIELDEQHLDAVTAVSASGAGFVFEFAAAMQAAAEATGLPANVAHTLVTETLLGSSRLLARTNEDPNLLRDQVTSPNGTTYAGLSCLKAADFRGLILNTVLAARARASELSKDT